jgi:ubiquitin carboxyl-terminal hydrolase 7
LQEAQTLYMECIERALDGTHYHEKFLDLFFRNRNKIIICKKCNHSFYSAAKYRDIELQVQNMKNLEESISSIFEPEILEGENKYQCDNCNMKTDAYLFNNI